MASDIDPTKPTESTENPDGTFSHPTTASVRKNFSAAAVEIIALQAEVDTLSSAVVVTTAHLADTNNPHNVTEAQAGVLIRSVDTDIFTASANQLTLVPGGLLREHYFNGLILEASTMTVAESAGVVTLTIGAATGSTLRYFFSDFNGQLTGLPDTSIDSTGELTLGTATVPVKNYVYLLQSDKTLHAGTSFPAAEHAAIGTITLQDAASVATNGAISLQLWHDYAEHGDGQGHFSHLASWIRAQHATWLSGIACSLTAGASGKLDFAATSGSVRQMHTHAFPAFDTSGTGTAGVIYIVNDNTAPYTKKTDGLGYAGSPEYSDGSSVSNNDRYSVVIWGIVSEETGTCKIFANLPSGGYSTDADAQADVANKSVFTIPADYVGVGFLISRAIVKYQSAGGGTFTEIECEDLRGLLPGSLGGGGTGTSPTEFDESVFRITDTIDNTKKIAFEADDLSAGVTRTINMPDNDVDLTDITTKAYVDSTKFVANVLDYGAVGDGVTDDASAISAAITAVNAVGGGTVELPFATYAIASVIDVPQRVNFFGESATLKLTHADAKVRLSKTAGGNATNRNGSMRGITIDGNLTANIGLQIGVIVHKNFKDVHVESCLQYGIVLDGTQNSHFDNVTSNGKTAAATGSWRIINGTAGNKFDSCSGNKSAAHLIFEMDVTSEDYDASLGSVAALNNVFTSCIFEYGASALYSLKAISAERNTFVRCGFNSSDTNPTSVILLDTAAGLNSFVDCYINGHSKTMTSMIEQKGEDNSFYGTTVAGYANATWVFRYYTRTTVVGLKETSAGGVYLATKLFNNQTGLTPADRLLFVLNVAGFTTASTPPWDANTHASWWDTDLERQVIWDGANKHYLRSDSPIFTLSNSATPFVTRRQKCFTGGVITITNLQGGVEGQEITIISKHNITITDGTNIFLNGSANFVMAPTDTLTLVLSDDSKWYEISRSVN